VATPRISRRGLIALAAAMGAAVGCAPAATPTPAPKPAAAPPATKPAEVAKPAEAPKPTVAPTLAAAAPPTLAPVATKPAAVAAATPAAKPDAAGAATQTLRMAFVPSADSGKVLSTGQPLGEELGKLTGLKFEVSVPTSYAAVIEAMGSGRVDVGWLAPFAYVIAKDKYGSDVILTTTRQGSKTYRSQIITHVDSGVAKIEDLQGKKFAFPDPASASGFLYPSAYLKERNFDPKTFFSEVVYAGGHDKVVIAVYQKSVAGGATFGRSTDAPGAPLTDARTNVQSTLPDVLDKVKIVTETDPIPNDTVSVRRGLEAPLVDKVKTGLLQLARSDTGKKLLTDLYRIDGLVEGTDSDYDPIRKKAQLVGLNIEQQVLATPVPPKPAGTPASTPPPKA
jgi:phosphonate transport system substrate-binding protein